MQTSTRPRSLTSILDSLCGQLLMVQDLFLALNADNIESCFISSDISFHKLDSELDRHSVSTEMCSLHVSTS